MKASLIAFSLASLAMTGCQVRSVGSAKTEQRAATASAAKAEQAKSAQPTAAVQPAALQATTAAPIPTAVPHPDQVLLIHDGQETWNDGAALAKSGYTIVDLGDDWTPFIFAEQHGEKGEDLPNRYRRVFLGLANDTLDEDGEPLPVGEKNYLELYGIPPSLGVLRARFLADEKQPCHDNADLKAMEAVETVSYVAPDAVKADELKLARLKREVEDAQKKLGVSSLSELATKDPKQEPKIKLIQRRSLEKAAMTEVEKRLACEGLLKPSQHHTVGVYDEAMKSAVRHFQQKHMIYESNYLRQKTMDYLARPLLTNDHDGFLRVLRERVVAAAGVVEDGSVDGAKGAPTYKSATGAQLPVRNLAEELTKAAAEQLGVNTPEGALAFLKRHSAEEFRHLRAAVKLPALPEYYGPHMDLSIVIDRGEVWYDLPWDAAGVRHAQPRRRYPSFHLYVTYNQQRIPLARWRTTIGGWRAEQAGDGYEYFRYKGSDVGARVIRNVVAGPVWIAPESTPTRSLVKAKTVNGAWSRVVNYDELGPGYLSAYGLVAGYLVSPGKDGRPDWDNGIRIHGSSEYLSMYSADGYSHGCHRLPNHLALRLYAFILHHRTMTVLGDQYANIARQFLIKDDVFEIRIPSRGYSYQLEPPLPVTVLEGDIRGNLRQPVTTYVPKPGIKYPSALPALPNSAEARTGRSAGDDKGAP